MTIKSSVQSNKKRSKTKNKEPSDKPKRPLSAYNLFFRYQRDKILRETSQPSYKPRRSHGKIGFAELARSVAEAWKSLDPLTKSRFDAKAREEKERYEQAVDAWNRARVAKMTSVCSQVTSLSSVCIPNNKSVPTVSPTLMFTPTPPLSPTPVHSMSADVLLPIALSLDTSASSNDSPSLVSFENDDLLEDSSNLLREAVGMCEGDEYPIPQVPNAAYTPHTLHSFESIASTFDDECFNILAAFKTIT